MKGDWDKFLPPRAQKLPERQLKIETACGDGEEEDGDDDDDDDLTLHKVKDEDDCSPDLLSISDSSPPLVPLDCPASTSPIGHHQIMVADILPELKTRKRVQKMEERLKHTVLSPGWGSQLPDSVHHQEVPTPHGQMWWRPWETEEVMLNMRLEEKQVEERTGAGTDPSTNSTECPLLPATELLTLPLLTPSKAAFSPFYPSPPRGRLLRRARKKRSLGDLLRRRQRLIEYQLNHTPSSSPSKPEPDQSTGVWKLGSASWFMESGFTSGTGL